jgi:hypothetical protein
MTKQDAMDEFGCKNLAQLARVLNVTPAAISQWSDPLPDIAVRRVESALYRRIKRRRKPTP